MKKKVFSLRKYVDNSFEKRNNWHIIKLYVESWALECEGLTKEEMGELAFDTKDEWMIEIDAPLEFEGHVLQVGDCFEQHYGILGEYWKIKSIHDDYFMCDCYDKNGKQVLVGETKWYPKNIVKLIPEPKPQVKEVTMKELEEHYGCTVKVIK